MSASGRPVDCIGIPQMRACHAVNWVARLGSSATRTVPSASTPRGVTGAKPCSYGSWSPDRTSRAPAHRHVDGLDDVAELRVDVPEVEAAARVVDRERRDLAALEAGDGLRRRVWV